MEYKEKSTLPVIEAAYNQMTTVERSIADFFLNNKESRDFSAKQIAAELAVSEASLSRFSKKCGFKGYREFIYLYESGLKSTKESIKVTDSSQKALQAYETLLSKSWSLLDEVQIAKVSSLINQARRVFTAGEGSSGFAAQEMAYRFMRIGVEIEAITTPDIMKMQSVLRRPGDLCFGLSLSCTTLTVLDFLKKSKERGAWTILITANYLENIYDYCDMVLLVPSLDHLNYGRLITPQFPLLVMIDLIYGTFMSQDMARKENMLIETARAIDRYNE